MKRCYFVRHGQTAWNGENRIQGHSDVPLSPLGQEQAKRVGAFFASRHLQAVFTSSLARSQQTARAIIDGNGHGVAPVVEEGLVEIHLGVWEGLTPAEIDAQYNGAYEQWKLRPSMVIIPEAEPVDAFRARVRRTLEKVLSTCQEDGEYVIVSHGGVIAAVLADTLGADFDALLRRLRLDNAGITALEFGTRLPHVLWINATTHLETFLHPPFGHVWF